MVSLEIGDFCVFGRGCHRTGVLLDDDPLVHVGNVEIMFEHLADGAKHDFGEDEPGATDEGAEVEQCLDVLVQAEGSVL